MQPRFWVRDVTPYRTLLAAYALPLRIRADLYAYIDELYASLLHRPAPKALYHRVPLEDADALQCTISRVEGHPDVVTFAIDIDVGALPTLEWLAEDTRSPEEAVAEDALLELVPPKAVWFKYGLLHLEKTMITPRMALQLVKDHKR